MFDFLKKAASTVSSFDGDFLKKSAAALSDFDGSTGLISSLGTLAGIDKAVQKLNNVAQKSSNFMSEVANEIIIKTDVLQNLAMLNKQQSTNQRPLIMRQTNQIIADALKTVSQASQLILQESGFHLGKIKQMSDLAQIIQAEIMQIDEIQKDLLPNNTTSQMIQTVQKYDEVVALLQQKTKVLIQQVNSQQGALIGLANTIQSMSNQPMLTNDSQTQKFVEDPIENISARQIEPEDSYKLDNYKSNVQEPSMKRRYQMQDPQNDMPIKRIKYEDTKSNSVLSRFDQMFALLS